MVSKMDWNQALFEVGLNVPLDKTEFNIVCPLHQDRTASCGINTEKGLWTCYAGCGGGTLKSLLINHFGVSRLKLDSMVLEQKSNFFDINLFDLSDRRGVEEAPEYTLQGNPRRTPNWALERGFNYKTLGDWGCRLAEQNGLEIPVRDLNHRIVGSITRRPIAEPKYMYSKGLPKKDILFGAERIRGPVPFVCVVEGSLDALWLYQHGYNAVALLGGTISTNQAEVLRKLRTSELVMATDNDDAGKKAAKAVKACIAESFVVSYIELPVGAKDIQDVRNADDLHSVIANRNYW